MANTGWSLQNGENVIGRCGAGVRRGHFHRLAGLRSEMTSDSLINVSLHEVVDVAAHMAANVVANEGVDVFGHA